MKANENTRHLENSDLGKLTGEILSWKSWIFQKVPGNICAHEILVYSADTQVLTVVNKWYMIVNSFDALIYKTNNLFYENFSCFR